MLPPIYCELSLSIIKNRRKGNRVVPFKRNQVTVTAQAHFCSCSILWAVTVTFAIFREASTAKSPLLYQLPGR